MTFDFLFRQEFVQHGVGVRNTVSKVNFSIALLELVLELNLKQSVRTELVGVAVLDITNVATTPLPLG